MPILRMKSRGEHEVLGTQAAGTPPWNLQPGSETLLSYPQTKQNIADSSRSPTHLSDSF